MLRRQESLLTTQGDCCGIILTLHTEEPRPGAGHGGAQARGRAPTRRAARML